MTEERLVMALLDAFSRELIILPSLTLRGADDVDSFRAPSTYDPMLDIVTDMYLERYYHGVAHLDAQSWRHYLPPLLAYTSRHRRRVTEVAEAVLWSMRPPDRDPPRLASLSIQQAGAVDAVLESLERDPDCAQRAFVAQVRREWHSQLPRRALG
jgi:hypothetical protein